MMFILELASFVSLWMNNLYNYANFWWSGVDRLEQGWVRAAMYTGRSSMMIMSIYMVVMIYPPLLPPLYGHIRYIIWITYGQCLPLLIKEKVASSKCLFLSCICNLFHTSPDGKTKKKVSIRRFICSTISDAILHFGNYRRHEVIFSHGLRIHAAIYRPIWPDKTDT